MYRYYAGRTAEAAATETPCESRPGLVSTVPFTWFATPVEDAAALGRPEVPDLAGRGAAAEAAGEQPRVERADRNDGQREGREPRPPAPEEAAGRVVGVRVEPRAKEAEASRKIVCHQCPLLLIRMRMVRSLL